MGNKTAGMIDKYEVARTDGSDETGRLTKGTA